MTKTIQLTIQFKEEYQEIPTIKIIIPTHTHVKSVSKVDCIIQTKVNIHTANGIRVELVIKGKHVVADFQLQFCPACGMQLDEYPVITYLAVNTKTGQLVPGTPTAICTTCGNTFVPRIILMQMVEKKKCNIVLPNNVMSN